MSGLVDFAFVHGGGQAGWVWEETIAAMRLQDDGVLGDLLALDAPGCGAKRNQPADGMKMAEVVASLIEDVEKAGLERAILVGHSQAGQPMPYMARLRPDLFQRLVYVTCSAPLRGQSVGQMMGNSLRGTNDTEVGWPVDPKTTNLNERFTSLFCNDMTPAQASSFLARLGKDRWPAQTYNETGWSYDDFGGVPATYVVCLKDQALPVSWQLEFAERFKVERLIHIDAGHQIMNTRPHALAEALRVDATSQR